MHVIAIITPQRKKVARGKNIIYRVEADCICIIAYGLYYTNSYTSLSCVLCSPFFHVLLLQA